MVKDLPAKQELQEMWVRSLGWEDPLEEEMATESSIPFWDRGAMHSLHGQRSLAGYRTCKVLSD